MTPARTSRTAVLACASAVAGVAASVVIVRSTVAVASRDAPGNVALDSVAATVGVFVAYLFYGRFEAARLRRDALLCAALLVLAGANTALSVLPLVAGQQGPPVTASAFAGLGAGALFTVAVWGRPSAAHRAWHGVSVPLRVVLAACLVLAVAEAAGAVLPRSGAGSADSFGSTGDVLVTATQLLAAACFAAAAVGWCRPAVRGDGVAPAMAAASVFAALSRVDFALATSPNSPWFTAGTLLRVAFYLTLVASAVVEIRSYWARLAQVAVLEERRRIARDLHDGLAQELAFTATQARALAERSEHPTRARLVAGAAERALDESRRAIAALTRPLDEPLEVAVAQCAEEVCGRFEATLLLDVDPGIEASADTREAVLRILREAVSNALRHGRARCVVVRLSGPSPVRLQVEDDGSGFDVTDLSHLSGRFGLVSMRERAESLGGTLVLGRRQPRGTTVEVVLP